MILSCAPRTCARRRATGNGLTATVVDASFQGAVRAVRLQAAGLGELTAAPGGAGQAPAPGSTVSLTWDDDHAWLISTGDRTP